MRWSGCLIVLLAGCAPPKRATMEQLYARSSFELACAPSEMQLFDFGRRVKGVAGCGRRLTYVERCDGSECAWVLDTPGRDQLAWPSTPPVAATAPPPPAPAWTAPPPPPPVAPAPAAPAPVATVPPANDDFGF